MTSHVGRNGDDIICMKRCDIFNILSSEQSVYRVKRIEGCDVDGR